MAAASGWKERISIHALREEGDDFHANLLTYRPISIHALREEGDKQHKALSLSVSQFLSTPSARRATAQQRAAAITVADFYPRPPRGGRRNRGGTGRAARGISIHALREEGDRRGRPAYRSPRNFYPRPPRGGRRLTSATTAGSTRFLSTPSARRATSTRRFRPKMK